MKNANMSNEGQILIVEKYYLSLRFFSFTKQAVPMIEMKGRPGASNMVVRNVHIFFKNEDTFPPSFNPDTKVITMYLPKSDVSVVLGILNRGKPTFCYCYPASEQAGLLEYADNLNTDDLPFSFEDLLDWTV